MRRARCQQPTSAHRSPNAGRRRVERPGLPRRLLSGSARPTGRARRRDRGRRRAAAEYVDAIVTFCEQLSRFPARGVPRDDLLAGLRVTHYRGRTVIAYRISGGQVAILGVYYGGQDYVADFRASFDD
ncbi:hypothetical protein C5O80_12440 [Burkholderia sp. SRS-46]|nr:hypothetical protein C5O80_12440 [Burkholderia sp. SRS-46]